MADEVRRSGRATKGQYTKERDIDEAPAKKKGKTKGSKAKIADEEDDEEDFVRCVCGEYEAEEDEPRSMICCDKCTAWEHNECMGLPEDYAPDKYFCEQCKPEDHKDLLAAMARGEKPWEEAIRKREAAQVPKKKGKKGRKSGAADEVPEPKAATPSAGQKRKAEEPPVVSETKGSKKARGTPAAETNGKPAASRKKSETPSRQATAVVGDVKELPIARKGPAQSLVKMFVDQTKSLVKSKDIVVPGNQTAEAFATGTGLAIENAVYQVRSGGAGEPSDAYKEFVRSLFTNLRRNKPLTAQILKGEITPDELAGMNVEDLATDEQKQKDAALLKEQEKQHIIVGESQQGPRIRRTHKGDEYVDDSVVPESTSQPVPKKPKQEEAKSPEIKSPTAPARKPPSVTIPRRQSGEPRRQSSSNFDINNVWGKVQGSPDGEQPRFGDAPQAVSPVREPAGPGARADADIDELLKDEDPESPPYSPKDDPSAEGTVWRGVINGGSLGRFHTFAKHAAGATPNSETLQTTWAALLPEEIGIGGRIAPSKADDYLCGLEWSNSSDLLIISMAEPENQRDLEQFDRFFRYFKSKDRFGVGQQHHNPALKDIYFVPLEKGEEMPTFVKKLESDWPNQAAERMLLVPLVVRNAELPHNIASAAGQTPSQVDGTALQSPGIQQTPITPRDDWHSNMHGPNGSPAPGMPPHMQPQSQGAPNGAQPHYASPTPPYPTLPPQSQSQSNPQHHPLPTPHPHASLPHAPPAALAAHRILGPDATKPAVLQLISSAPNAGDEEMRVIKECISQDERAAFDLGLLTSLLQERHQRQQEGGSAMEGVESNTQ